MPNDAERQSMQMAYYDEASTTNTGIKSNPSIVVVSAYLPSLLSIHLIVHLPVAIAAPRNLLAIYLWCFIVDTYYSDQLYTHVQIANFVTACDTEW